MLDTNARYQRSNTLHPQAMGLWRGDKTFDGRA